MENVKTKAVRTRKTRDPNAPKRPASAYLLYANEHREEVRAANPAAKPTEVTRILGQQWKSLADADRAVYQRRYAEAKQAYDHLIAERSAPRIN